MNLRPEEVLFIDDNIDNIKRAHGEGIKVIHFINTGRFIEDIGKFLSYGLTKTSP